MCIHAACACTCMCCTHDSASIFTLSLDLVPACTYICVQVLKHACTQYMYIERCIYSHIHLCTGLRMQVTTTGCWLSHVWALLEERV